MNDTISKKIIDISIPIEDTMHRWPNSDPFEAEQVHAIKTGDTVNETRIHMGTHAGTHIDAPLHFIEDGMSIDAMPLSQFVGPAYVVHIPNVTQITARDLEQAGIPHNTSRILFRTANSDYWQEKKVFTKEYVGLTADAAFWLAEHALRLVGVDYLSVASFEDIEEVHKILLGNGVALLEGIDLSNVQEGGYILVSVPIYTIGTEGAPTRAFLLENNEQNASDDRTANPF